MKRKRRTWEKEWQKRFCEPWEEEEEEEEESSILSLSPTASSLRIDRYRSSARTAHMRKQLEQNGMEERCLRRVCMNVCACMRDAGWEGRCR
jgi:hypothetical protein